MDDSIWARRHQAAAKIDCEYFYNNGRSANGKPHCIIRDGKKIGRAKLFNVAMQEAIEALYSGIAPPVQLNELLVS